MDTLKAQALIQLTLDTKPLEKGARDAKKKLLGLVDVKGLLKKQVAGNLIGGGITAAFGGIASMVGDAATATLDFERSLTRLQIAGDRTAAQMAPLRTKINAVSKATSVNRQELLNGAQAYVTATGDLDGATVALETFGKVAIASGSDMADIARTAASLKKNLQIDPKDFQGAFDILITQGKAGAIELNELATLMSGIAPMFSVFKGGSGMGGLAQVGSALQVGRGAFGTSAETVTGLRNFITSIQRNAKRFKGIKLYDGKDKNGVPQLREFRSIIMDIGNSKLAKKEGGLLKAFGGTEELRFFNEVFGKIKDYDRILSEGGKDAVNKDYGVYLASTAGRLETAMNTLKVSIAEAFTPERIEAFVKACGEIAGYLGTAVGFAKYLLNGSKTDDELKEVPIDERAKRGEERRLAAARRMFPKRGDLTDEEYGYFSRLETSGGDAAEIERQKEEIKRDRLLASLTPAESKALGEQLQREAYMREALGGEGEVGSGGKSSALVRGPGGHISAANAIAMSDAIMGSANRDEMLRLQADAISKAMRRELEQVNLLVKTYTSPDATAKEVKGAPRARATKGGRS